MCILAHNQLFTHNHCPMNIGDKVRMLHSSEEGIITKLIDAFLVEVEIEEGFNIPVKRSEVVRIAKEEAQQFGSLLAKKSSNEDKSSISKIRKSEPVIAQKGIYIAFVPVNDRQHTLYVINNTDYTLPFVVGNEKESKYLPLFAGKLDARSHQRVYEVNILDINEWGVFIFQFLFFDLVKHQNRPPFIKKLRFRAKTFFKAQQKAPVIGKDAFLFQLDQDEPSTAESEQIIQTPVIDPVKLKEKMYENHEKATTIDTKIVIKAPKIEVDLHIEELSKEYALMNSGEILELQIKTFEQNLESAIVAGLREITFIHGVGNGKLRHELHKRLSGHPDIDFYKDAQKEKFGYGATLVRLK